MTNTNKLKPRHLLIAALAGVAMTTTALAAGMQGGGHGSGHHNAATTGEPGNAAQADRTIAVTMRDNFYEPEQIEVKAGETIRFVITNAGEFLHEFNIGTAAMHAAHQKEMATMMEHGMITPTGIDHQKMKMDHGGGHMMKHDDANAVLVQPGKSAEVVWKFTEAAELEFACNIPGHYEAGMMGHIRFRGHHGS
jgi:uncharacterized cupredoxin-like copper-binding protein